MNREEWLTKLTEKMRPMYTNLGETIPDKIRLTCGWPSKGAFAKKRRVGECWKEQASKDSHVEVFVSPCISNGVEVGEVLAHELIHAAGHHHHRKSFKRVAEQLGLEGKMTATVAGQLLKDRLNVLVKELGEYPHAVLDKTQSPHKKDGTRMIKVICSRPNCGYTVRTTKKWIDSMGCPTCPCDAPMGLAEGETEPEDKEDGE